MGKSGIVFMSVDDLVFDPHNPRLPTSKSGIDDEEVYRYMLNECNVIDLLLSITTQGYFEGEPLLITKSLDHPGKYEVLEGNRRLAAINLLLKPSLAPVKKDSVQEIVKTGEHFPTQVPVLIYESRDEILEYLGYRHITGVEEWNSLAKAKYLFQLKELYPELKYNDVLKKLAKLIGSRADYVHRLLAGHRVYKKIEDNSFYNIPGLSEESFQFSLLTTALSYSNISKFIGISSEKEEEVDSEINEGNLKNLSEWVFKETEGKTRLGESRNLKTLNAVVVEPRALNAFKDGRPLQEAGLLTDEPGVIFSSSIQQAMKRIRDAKDQSHQVPEPKAADLDNLKDIVFIARELYGIVRDKLDTKNLDGAL